MKIIIIITFLIQHFYKLFKYRKKKQKQKWIVQKKYIKNSHLL